MAKKAIDKVIAHTKVWSGYFAIALGLLIAFWVVRAGLFWNAPRNSMSGLKSHSSSLSP